jgi:hypothetical protein
VVFMRGHLTLVRNSPETEMKIMRWDHFRNFDEWEYFGYPNPSIGAYDTVLHQGVFACVGAGRVTGGWELGDLNCYASPACELGIGLGLRREA